jgi:hypothetical protein
MHIHTHTYTYTCMHTYMYVCAWFTNQRPNLQCIYAYTYIRMCINIHTHTYIPVTHTHTYLTLTQYIYTHIHIYTYIHIKPFCNVTRQYYNHECVVMFWGARHPAETLGTSRGTSRGTSPERLSAILQPWMRSDGYAQLQCSVSFTRVQQVCTYMNSACVCIYIYTYYVHSVLIPLSHVISIGYVDHVV